MNFICLLNFKHHLCRLAELSRYLKGVIILCAPVDLWFIILFTKFYYIFNLPFSGPETLGWKYPSGTKKTRSVYSSLRASGRQRHWDDIICFTKLRWTEENHWSIAYCQVASDSEKPNRRLCFYSGTVHLLLHLKSWSFNWLICWLALVKSYSLTDVLWCGLITIKSDYMNYAIF